MHSDKILEAATYFPNLERETACQSFEVFDTFLFFAAAGFDYDPDRALNERQLEEKDETYFAKKGNLSFEAAKGINLYSYFFFSVCSMSVSYGRVIIYRLKRVKAL